MWLSLSAFTASDFAFLFSYSFVWLECEHGILFCPNARRCWDNVGKQLEQIRAVFEHIWSKMISQREECALPRWKMN